MNSSYRDRALSPPESHSSTADDTRASRFDRVRGVGTCPGWCECRIGATSCADSRR